MKVVEEVEEETESPDGRRRRKIRPPAKFAELVQVQLNVHNKNSKASSSIDN